MPALPSGRAVPAGDSLARSEWRLGLAAVSARKLLAALVLLFCGSTFWLTEPRIYADTVNYALHIVQHWQGHFAAGRDPIWEFGHVIWRPLGYLLWRLTGGPQSSVPLIHAAHGLIGVNIVATCAAALLFYLLAANFTGSAWAGFAAAVAFVSSHAVLNYSQAGTAYVPGAACQVAALYLFERQLRNGRQSATTWLLPSIFLGLSVVFWFPYALAVPGILLFALMYRAADFSGRLPLMLKSAAVFSLMLIGAYAMAISLNHITSFAMAHEWYFRAQHGISQTHGYLRAATGIPRGFLFLGDDGILWKRLLFQHNLGMHGLSLVLLLFQMAWKLLAVYGFVCVVFFGLLRLKGRWSGGKVLLPVLIAAAVPVLFFAIVVFEAGPIERYLPVLPLLFLSAAYLLSRGSRLSRTFILAFFALLIAVNMSALSRAASRTRWADTSAKLSALERVSDPADVLFLVSFQDDAFRMSEEQPFHPAILAAPTMHIVAELQSADVAEWRDRVVRVALASWSARHRVWVSKHLLASQPEPGWNWVEGDDARIHWSEFPSFFRPLQAASECCGGDGYVLLAQTPQNMLLLRMAGFKTGR